MPWNAVWPIGNISVKANRTTGNQNTTYIQTTMGNSIVGTNTAATRDHFWNISANVDGRHRFIQSPAFTVGAVATDPVIGTGMDAVNYLKTTNGRAEWFHRNTQGIYQYTPSVIRGTVTIASTYNNLVAVPANCYGEVFMFKNSDKGFCQQAIFSSKSDLVRAFSLRVKQDGTANSYYIEFDNLGGSAFMLRVRRGDSGSFVDGTWNYIVTYSAQFP